ncbi:MAG: ArsR/SmtB family transcription factor [Acidimicrobiia bacterium]
MSEAARRESGLLDDLFGALADPTRRALLQRLLQHGPETATRLAVDWPLSRQAVVKHLQALVEAGLATPQREGREVRYAATPEPLSSALAWLLESSAHWDQRIERLRRSTAGISPGRSGRGS